MYRHSQDAPHAICTSLEEASIYLSTYNVFDEHKPSDIIKERLDKDLYLNTSSNPDLRKGYQQNRCHDPANNLRGMDSIVHVFGVPLTLDFLVVLRYCPCFLEGLTSMPWHCADQSQTTRGRLRYAFPSGCD